MMRRRFEEDVVGGVEGESVFLGGVGGGRFEVVRLRAVRGFLTNSAAECDEGGLQITGEQ
jgi:hypothetical protein